MTRPAFELDLAFDPAPTILHADADSKTEHTRLSASEDWRKELTAWLQTMRTLQPPACPASVRQARGFSLGLQLTDDATIADLNGRWRNKQESTDVLSFAALDEAPPLIEAPCLELGDIIVSVPTARKQASDHGHDLLWELRWLVSHGFLHLLGWDHPNEALLSAMLRCQEQLLGKSGMVLGQREGGRDATSELTTAP